MEKYDYLDLLKCKFKWEGTTVEEGFDCMTFIIEMGKRRGLKVPNINHQDISINKSFVMFQDPKHYELFTEVSRDKDTLVLMKNDKGVIGHVGYMLDKNNFIHMTRDQGVLVTRINDKIYKNRIVGYYLPKET